VTLESAWYAVVLDARPTEEPHAKGHSAAESKKAASFGTLNA
jgi:hypothetical protein